MLITQLFLCDIYVELYYRLRDRNDEHKKTDILYYEYYYLYILNTSIFVINNTSIINCITIVC